MMMMKMMMGTMSNMGGNSTRRVQQTQKQLVGL